ncbi:MAG TPA: MiaB/RimO family radical SAM methylthiotransferase [Ktedonobacterales bacterium]|jgi:tRNA-2-methylthio-N6-dimethylallyladenosine synthase
MSTAQGKYHIWTVGCQMNQADSQRVASILDGLGWREVPTMDTANLVVLNTCSVREQPEKRAHGQLGLLSHAKRHREDLLVAMMGCMIGNQRTIDDLKHRYPVVDLFFKVEQADILPRFLDERWTPLMAGEGCVDVADLGAARGVGIARALPVLPSLQYTDGSHEDEAGLPLAPEPIPTAPVDGHAQGHAPGNHTAGGHGEAMAVNWRPGEKVLHYPTGTQAAARGPTAWLPVVLGCNKVCSYCIVPSRRGRERSRPLSELVGEARDLVASGAREVTLLGQTVEAYGLDLPDQHADLADLMGALSDIGGLERIRFMTSYPRHFTDKLIHQMAALPKVCEHVNIPVQHGDDGMLTRMRRGYGLAEYRALIDRLRAWWPGVSLSTDVIVGFCGESEEEFQHTLDLLEEIRFDVVHVAAYSPRPGTLAFKWPDDVPMEVKKRRLHAVEDAQERISRELNQAYVGRTEPVLIEEHLIQHGRHLWRGRTRTNRLVFFPAVRPSAMDAGEAGVGTTVPVRIERTSAWSLQGALATPA